MEYWKFTGPVSVRSSGPKSRGVFWKFRPNWPSYPPLSGLLWPEPVNPAKFRPCITSPKTLARAADAGQAQTAANTTQLIDRQ